jgi:hypothetical protein
MKRSWWKHVLPASRHDIERILMNQAELAQALKELTAQLQKANTELQAKIKALTDAINNNTGDVPQEVVDAANALKVAVQGVDDIVPDAPPVP